MNVNRAWRVAGISLAGWLLAAGAQAESVKITAWIPHFEGQNLQTLWNDVIYPDFRAAHPDIEVELVTPGDFQAYRDQLMVAYVAGAGPDLFEVGAQGEISKYVANNMALQLDHYIDAWPGADDFLPTTWSDGEYLNKRYAVPAFVDPRGLVARIDLIQESGLDPDHITDGWDPFLQAVKKLSLTAADGTVRRRGLNLTTKGKNTFEEWLIFLDQAGGQLIDGTGQPGFADGTGVESFQYQLNLMQAALDNQAYGNGVDDSLYSGGLAMTFRDGIGEEEDIVEAGMEQEVRPLLPLMGPVRRSTTGFINALAISNQSKHPDAAFALISFLMQPQYSIPWARTGGWFSPLKEQSTDSEVRNDPILAGFAAMLPYGMRYFNKTPAYFDIRSAVFPHLVEAIQGKTPAQSVITQIEPIVTGINANQGKK